MEKLDTLLATMGPFELWSMKSDSGMVYIQHQDRSRLTQGGLDEAAKFVELYDAQARGNA